MRARVIEPCVYDNVFRNVDDIVEGTQEEMQAHIDFGYVEAIEEAKDPGTEAKDPGTEAQEPESEAQETEPAKAKPKPSKSRSKK